MWKEFKISLLCNYSDDRTEVVGTTHILECELDDFENYMDVFDRKESTTVFSQLFEDEQTLKHQIAKDLFIRYGTDILLFDTVYVLDHAHIEEEFRGNGLFKLMLEKALSALKIDGAECAFLVYAFPLQYNRKNQNISSKLFKRDCKRLSRFYESLGFLKLLSDEEGTILIHNTGMDLKPKKQNHNVTSTKACYIPTNSATSNYSF